MTSIAFGLGVLPLAISRGAGSGSQNAIGTGIVGGAVTTTLLGLFFVPLYFVTILALFRVKPLKAPGGGSSASPSGTSTPPALPKGEEPSEERELAGV
jgi:hypothetical protein